MKRRRDEGRLPAGAARSGVAPGLIPAVLIVFGIGAVIGVTLGGRFGDTSVPLVVLALLKQRASSRSSPAAE